MTIKYLKFFKKYIAIYHGQAVAVGNTHAEAIAEAIRPSLLVK